MRRFVTVLLLAFAAVMIAAPMLVVSCAQKTGLLVPESSLR